MFCANCHVGREAGQLLRAVDRLTGRSSLLCRPSIDWRCFADGVGPARRFSIALVDLAAAREYDRRTAGARP